MKNTKSSVIFPKCNANAFYKELKEQVDSYFKHTNLSKLGNFEIYFKSAMLVLFFALVYSMLFFFTSSAAIITSYLLLGVSATLLMFNVCHDITHDCFSKNRFVNSFLLLFGELFFANKYSWKLKHNEGHHTYTNIEGHDDDIDLHNLIRISKTEKRRRIHRIQHWYAPFLYCMLTLQWLVFSDMFFQIKVFREKKLGLRPIFKTIACKLSHIVLFLILPLIYVSSSAWIIILGFFCMHFIFGLTMSVIFQLAHIVDNVEFPTPNNDGEMEHSWAIHEMYTTSDFGKANITHYLLGGLSFQVEHHLFPNICHTHYKNISPIVRQTAEKFNIPYRHYPTVLEAIKAHFRFLKMMGQRHSA